ncbi:MAG: sodium:alanine symporter family protein [Lachnospiraceae bacterium]|nr:sodium:alanine symporter family protein [Lachnospiraceae bacterium]
MNTLSHALHTIDEFVWGPCMLLLLVGTGALLTVRTRFLPWRMLPGAIKSTLRRNVQPPHRTDGGADGISPFAALMTSLAATIGTGNIVGVSTAMVLGGPGALVWMWIAAAFGIASKFSECMLAVKYRERNAKGDIVGGPMYTLKNAFPRRRAGAILAFLFALSAAISSFGIGNMTQANSIADALRDAFAFPAHPVGIALTVLTLFVIVGGIRSISKIASVLVPSMAVLYVAAGLLVLLVHYRNIPDSLVRIITMAFSPDALTGGFLGTVTASMLRAMRYGVARGVFSNEAGMGSAAITAASAACDHPVRQGYLNMTATFWDTIIVCTITGLCIVSSGVLGSTETVDSGSYANHSGQLLFFSSASADCPAVYDIAAYDGSSLSLVLNKNATDPDAGTTFCTDTEITLTRLASDNAAGDITERSSGSLTGSWRDPHGCVYTFHADGTYEYAKLLTGAALTIAAFRSGLGNTGAYFLSISIVLFAFSTILGWEYLGERAWEYLMKTHKYNMLYRVMFSLAAYVGATAALEPVWDFSNIANALMAVPNLICLLALSGEIARDVRQYQKDFR